MLKTVIHLLDELGRTWCGRPQALHTLMTRSAEQFTCKKCCEVYEAYLKRKETKR